MTGYWKEVQTMGTNYQFFLLMRSVLISPSDPMMTCSCCFLCFDPRLPHGLDFTLGLTEILRKCTNGHEFMHLLKCKVKFRLQHVSFASPHSPHFRSSDFFGMVVKSPVDFSDCWKWRGNGTMASVSQCSRRCSRPFLFLASIHLVQRRFFLFRLITGLRISQKIFDRAAKKSSIKI